MDHPIAICVNPDVNPDPDFAQEFVDLARSLTVPEPTVVIPRDDPDLLPADCAAAIGFRMPAISDACREREVDFYMVITALDTTGEYLWGMEPRTELDPIEYTSEDWKSLVKESIPLLLDDRAAAVQAPFRNVLPVEFRERLTIWPARFKGSSGRSFRFIEPIGVGGTAVVSRVQDQNGKNFAAKALSRHRFPVGLTKERFSREAQVLSQVEHPNVVRIIDRAEIAESPVIVMEDLSEGSLHERLAMGRTPEPSLATRWIRETLTGVAELHSRQIVHRDLTPKNLLLRHNSIVVSDFGTVRHLDDATLTNSADQLGSLIYIAPEQFAEPHTARPQADVYSIGQIAFRLFTGLSPHGNTGHIHEHATQISGDLANVLESFRSYQANARPADAGRALSKLDAVLQKEIDRRQPWKTVIDMLEELFDPLPLMAKRLTTGKKYGPTPHREAALLRDRIETAVSNTILWFEDAEKQSIQLVEVDDRKALANLSKDSLGVVRGPNMDVYSVIVDEYSPESTSWKEGSRALFLLLSEWEQELLAGDVGLLPSSFQSESSGLEESYDHTIPVEKVWDRIGSDDFLRPKLDA